MKTKILVVAAHPDDEVLGCGGTIARFVKEGASVYTLILGEGKTARSAKKKEGKNIKEIAQLKKEAKKANAMLGVKDIILLDFPDNRFDSIPLLDIVKEIEKIKSKINPDIVFTHYMNDLNIDHKITYEAVITATRPIKGEVVKDIYSFEVLSSTEWKWNNLFAPNYFVDISDEIKAKCRAMKEYKSEIRKYPHPRSLKGIEIKAQQVGMIIGTDFAEAFRCVRVIR